MTTPQTIADAALQLRAGATTARELVESALAAIASFNPATNAFILVDEDGARTAAAAVDAERARGIDRGPLHGMPISLKDLIDVAGQPTTAASRVLHDRRAGADATVVARLREAGAVLIGKTNLHEFALGTTSEESAFGAVMNPHDAGHSAGGSSGGSAAAVATGMGLGSVGSDTGGSIRIPAAACGIVGLKPSIGDVPADGVVPLSVTLDHVGPLARTVRDAFSMWVVLAAQPAAQVDRLDAPGLRLCELTGYFAAPLSAEVRIAFGDALERLRQAGVTTSSAELDDTATIVPTYVNIVLPEGAWWHRTYLDTRAAEYTPAVRSRLEAGRAIAAVDYLKARETRLEWRRRVDAALEGCDALVLPTLPIVAPPLGATDVVIDPDGTATVPVRAAMLRQTQLFNITGHPAVSLPIAAPGLPVGLQLVGRLGQTPRLASIAALCEQILER